MNTPIQEAVAQYISQRRARFHTPGHKGAGIDLLAPVLPWDITEVDGTDSLYDAEGCILRCEEAFSRHYGSCRTLLSAGGSTLCIQTMLALAAHPGDTILAGRNSHVSAVNAMALLDLNPVWLYPEQNPQGVGAWYSPDSLGRALREHPEAKAVYLTSPDYFGVRLDIGAVAKICREHGIPLLVDNAHGAHLNLFPEAHPMALGASMCCDSLHKTLPVLTGGALLHIGDPAFAGEAKRKMSMFGSTSPSYLILLSIDRLLAYFDDGAADAYQGTAGRVAALRRLAEEKGFFVPPQETDPIRLALGFSPLGYSAEAFSAHARKCGAEPEYVSSSACVLLFSPFNREGDFSIAEDLIRSAETVGPPPDETPPMPPMEAACSLRDALLGEGEQVPVEDCAGRICACVKSPCPPGIPVAMPGERVCKEHINFLKKHGVNELYMVK